MLNPNGNKHATVKKNPKCKNNSKDNTKNIEENTSINLDEHGNGSYNLDQNLDKNTSIELNQNLDNSRNLHTDVNYHLQNGTDVDGGTDVKDNLESSTDILGKDKGTEFIQQRIQLTTIKSTTTLRATSMSMSTGPSAFLHLSAASSTATWILITMSTKAPTLTVLTPPPTAFSENNESGFF